MIRMPQHTAVPLRGGPALRWGILAPGGIARDWARTVLGNTDQRIVAVASRSLDRAKAFAAEFDVARAYGDYAQLVADPDVDIVYIAAPHSQHRPLALLAIAAGKPVLVEKPLGLSGDDARVIVEAARAAGVFAMEAMWSRFLPQTTVIERLRDDGVLGDIRVLAADFGSSVGADGANRIFDPALGGGALLDIGVYPLWFAQFVLGRPERVTATGTLTDRGVDEQVSLILDYPGGAQSLLSTGLRAATPIVATVSGSKARVELDAPFIAPSGLRVIAGDEITAWREPHGLSWREGLCYQATAVAAHIAAGRLEAPEHTLDDSLAVLDVIDEARSQLSR